MKRIVALVLGVLLFATTGVAQSSQTRSQAVSQLTGLGMSPELANEVAQLTAGAAAVIDNATWLKWRNAANSANLNVLRVNASDVTELNSGVTLNLDIAATPEAKLTDDLFTFTGNGAAIAAPTAIAFNVGLTPVARVQNQTFQFADIASAAAKILTTSIDGTDSNTIEINGGGGTGITRGSSFIATGNESSSNGGATVRTGNTAGSAIVFQNGSSTSSVQVQDNSATTLVQWGPVAAVPTMVSTPVAASNFFSPGLNVVPTAAANTAAFLGAATPVPGQQFRIYNSGPNAVRVKAGGAATMNGATAGGYITLATLATVDCQTTSATSQICLQPVIPTPAGP